MKCDVIAAGIVNAAKGVSFAADFISLACCNLCDKFPKNSSALVLL